MALISLIIILIYKTGALDEHAYAKHLFGINRFQLKNYIQVRAKKYPEIFLHLLPSSIVIKEDCIRKLKIAGLDGVTIFATRVEWWPPLDSGHGWDEIIPKIVVAADMVLLAPKGMDLLRVDCIVDMEGFNRHHFQRLFGIRPCIKMMNLFYVSFQFTMIYTI